MKASSGLHKKRIRLRISGVVQGVGFRPFVYRLAQSMGLAGFVMNSSQGVTVEAEGFNPEDFTARLRSEAPPLARIMNIETEYIDPLRESGFTILESRDQGLFTHVSADISICDDCKGELLDPADRRYLYPFINCTNCGPRYSITESVPYDRPNTTMRRFEMCAACRSEYEDPADRRFHAQPNACHDCGPQLLYMDDGADKYHGAEALARAVKALKAGKIVAVKGLGGFHLAADAANSEAVQELRDRKRRNNKSFALMAPDTGTIERFCKVSKDERRLLESPERPIVLLEKLQDASAPLPHAVAPASSELGFMLPYTPLHVLLFFSPPDGGVSQGENNFDALLMTSGNLSEEPIVMDNDSVRRKLVELADAYLMHDRDIFMRVDDSVVRAFEGQTLFIRRARGYVPVSVPLYGDDGPEVLACGTDLKNTFTLTRSDAAIVSQHIGDMENHESLIFFEETLNNLKSVYRIRPEAVTHDLHPGYFSTRWAMEQEDCQRWPIQHHYAHTASVMAVHGLREGVIGISLDGSGYGTDGTVWGGEFLLADINGFERVGRFRPVPLPGSTAGVHFPWMMAVSYLVHASGAGAGLYFESLGFPDRHGLGAIENCVRMAENRELSPMTSSAGRLFDAVSAMLGICDVNTFEGEAAMALEAAISHGVTEQYSYDIKEREMLEPDFSRTVRELLRDLESGMKRGIISARFHNTVVRAVVDMAGRINAGTGCRNVVLSGGVFQNRTMLRGVMAGIRSLGLRPFINTAVPCNDGGVSLGQAYIVRERIKAGIGSG